MKENKMSYDQWKTASPYDDEYDVTEKADRLIKRYKKGEFSQDLMHQMVTELENLISYIVNEEYLD